MFYKNIKKLFIPLQFLFVVFFICSCGEGVVDFGSQNYKPKIVVEAFIFPEIKPEDFKILRDFPLNHTIDLNTIVIKDATVKMLDLSTNKEYILQYNPQKGKYDYPGNDFIIGYDRTYKLSVKAVIDGKELITTSISTTPQKGFKIDREKSIINDIYYRETDIDSKMNSIAINPSPGTNSYLILLKSLDAKESNFIRENPYVNDEDTAKMIRNLDNTVTISYIDDINSSFQYIKKTIEWHKMYYYGRYQVIVYAADMNFRNFLGTYNNIDEMDGNLHEPKFNFDGDGIGVFGSTIADTCYFKLLKR